ncbi:AIPR family protein [Acinetobacter baumannii]|nr:AIPR family protein [Acinetobacter baumannii]
MLSGSNRVLLKIKYPKNQLFTKTDLAKYMMVWDHSEPKWVNMGAQKNFNKFSEYIIKNWKNMEIEGEINEYYFKKIVSRAIIFKETEKIVTSQPWYTNGYRANIVIYTLAYLSYYLKNQNKIIDYLKLWKEQSLTKAFEEVLVELTREINRILISPNLARTTNNISEWAKKDACWGTILAETSKLNNCIKDEFINELMDGNLENQNNEAKNKQRLTDSISIQNKINAIDKYYWKDFLNYLEKEYTLSFKERGILKLASVGRQNLSAKQCFVLGRILDKYQKDFDEYTSAEKETRENW